MAKRTVNHAAIFLWKLRICMSAIAFIILSIAYGKPLSFVRGNRYFTAFCSLRSRIGAYADEQWKLYAIQAGGNHIKKLAVQI